MKSTVFHLESVATKQTNKNIFLCEEICQKPLPQQTFFLSESGLASFVNRIYFYFVLWGLYLGQLETANKSCFCFVLFFLYWLVYGSHVMNFQVSAEFLAGWESEIPLAVRISRQAGWQALGRNTWKWMSLVTKQQFYSGKILLLDGCSLAKLL